MRIFFLLFLLVILSQAGYTQEILKGKVGGDYAEGGRGPLAGANVFWLNSKIQTTTDPEGLFEIEKPDSVRYLITSFVGYETDTIDTKGKDFIHNHKILSGLLDEVEIEHRVGGMEVNTLDPLNVSLVSERELQKAACCNLSESFETNPSIDVSFSDAITGTRQIQMLGLSGPNILITREMIPDLRGIGAVNGLQFYPGTWIQSMQISKGSGSVVNGFESVVGQINIELKKAESGKKAMMNVYGNAGSAMEFNGDVRSDISERISTASMIQLRNLSIENDNNSDGFRDMPLSNKVIALNRWKFDWGKGYFSQIGIRALYIDNEGGQLSGTMNETRGAWRLNHLTERMDVWAKTGKIWQGKPWRSTGIQMNGTFHDQNSNYGLRTYDARQRSLYFNWIYQSIISNTGHVVKMGLSYQQDNFNEQVDSMDFLRDEYVPGIFTEYTFLPNDRFTLVAGLRADHHNSYGTFLTPRLHLRYGLFEKTTIKLSAGRSLRTASIFAENQQIFASARDIRVFSQNESSPYGLDAEVSWNYGINLIQKFELDYREGALILDLYRTEFENQIVVDYDRSPQQVLFYNLNGRSYSNSIQAQLDYELINRLDMRLAYRWYDVKTQYHFDILQKPLISQHRAFINLEYKTRNYWSFDWTLNWNGSKRLPSTESNPESLRLRANSPDFYLMNAQITKTFNERFDLYLGSENILNFRQSNPIISADDPYGEYFDASLVWAPVFGRMVYLGARLKWL